MAFMDGNTDQLLIALSLGNDVEVARIIRSSSDWDEESFQSSVERLTGTQAIYTTERILHFGAAVIERDHPEMGFAYSTVRDRVERNLLRAIAGNAVRLSVEAGV